MKTIKLFIIAFLLFAGSSIQAQVGVDINVGTPNVNVHVGTHPAPPPVWAPVGYDDVEYYYLPDIQVYYDIRQAQYIYYGDGGWIRANHLPAYCRHYDLYHGYKVVLNDYHGNAPYTYYNNHKVKYYKGYNGGPQKNRGSYEEYQQYHHDNGKHNGQYKHGNYEDHQGNDGDHHDKHNKHNKD